MRALFDVTTLLRHRRSVSNDGTGVKEMNDPMTIYATAIYSAGAIAVLGCLADNWILDRQERASKRP